MTAQERNDEEEIKPPAQPWKLYIGIGMIGLIAFGLITWLLGLGPFAYRQLIYGTSEVYILNLTDQDVEVTLDKSDPLAIQPDGYQRTPILGGTTTLVTRNKAGEVLERVTVFVDGNPVVYNIKGARCLVLSDVSTFYDPTKTNEVNVLATYEKGKTVVNLPNEKVIWPRETLRDEVKEAEKGVSWVEIVACPMIDPEEKRLLSTHLSVLLTERKKRERELEIRRRMMSQQGSEAVDEFVTKNSGGSGINIKAADAGVERPEKTSGDTGHGDVDGK